MLFFNIIGEADSVVMVLALPFGIIA